MTNQFTKSELYFYFAYVIWLLLAVIKLTYLKNLIPYNSLYDLVINLVYVLLILKFFSDQKQGKRDFFGLFIVGVMYLLLKISEADRFIIFIYFIYSSRNIKFTGIFKVTIIIQLLVMSLSIITSLKGIIPNEIWDIETRARYSMGYSFCTYGSHIFFFLTLIYISIRNNPKTREVIILFIGNCIWYFVTKTRIDFLLFGFMVALLYLFRNFKLNIFDNMLKKLLIFASPIACFVSILVQALYNENNVLLLKLNSMLNGRIQLGNEAIDKYGITFLGKYIKWVGRGGIKSHPEWSYNYVDCSYLKYLLNFGLLFIVILIIGLMFAGNFVYRQKNIGLSIAYLLWVLYGMINAELFELAFQPFMLLCGVGMKSYFYNYEEKKYFISFKNEQIQWRLK